jgi:outer membrane protein
MKKIFLYLVMAVLAISPGAQNTAKFGKLSYESLLRAMPEFAYAQSQLEKLKVQFEAEATYNETSFRRQFAEFLQGQKEFPQSIMLKRQRDLQDAMERSIAFRKGADSLLNQARIEMELPLRTKLDSAIWAVGMERGYEYIINTDAGLLPFSHPQLTEDATPFVLEKLQGVKPEE